MPVNTGLLNLELVKLTFPFLMRQLICVYNANNITTNTLTPSTALQKFIAKRFDYPPRTIQI